MSGMERQYRYKAFISYSHKDEATAKWLHRALEGYSVPRHVVGRKTKSGTVPKSIKPVFRDQSELAVSANLSASVTEALADSEFLIVICSPNAVESAWVQQEILTFKRERGESNVLAVIASGEPFASDSADTAEQECFPSGLRHAMAPDGSESDARIEPMAADVRRGSGGKRLALLKLAAALLQVNLDELVRRDTQRRYRRLRFIAAGALAGMLVMGWLTVTAIQARGEAVLQRNSAEGLIEFMLGDLRDKLEPVGRLDVLDSVGEKALGYYEAQDESMLDADSLGRRSRALHLIGEIEDTRGNTEGALRTFQQAAESTAALLSRSPTDTQRIFDHSQSEFWVGYIAWQRGEYDTARTAFEEYLRFATLLVEADPENASWQQELAFAHGNLGSLAFEQQQWESAESAFHNALSIEQALAAASPDDFELQNQAAISRSWLTSVYTNARKFDEAAEQNRAQIEIYEQVLQGDGLNRTAQLQLLIAKRLAARLDISIGDMERAALQLLSADRIARELVNFEPENTVYIEQLIAVQRDSAEAHYSNGDFEAARNNLKVALDRTDDLIANDDTVMLWQVDYMIYCQLLLARMHFDEQGMDQAQSIVDEVFTRLADIEAEGSDIRQLPFVTGSAYLLAGDLREHNGDSSGARLSWQRAYAELDGPPETLDPSRLTVLIDVLDRLGMDDEARSIIASLEASRYRHPAYLRIRDQIR